MTRCSGHILVVDDEDANRDMLARRLTRRHFDVSKAAGGKEALELIENSDFDLVLLDLMMPGISGLDVLRKVRGHPSGNQLPFIVITAQRGRDSAVGAIEAGANDYISKPVDWPILMARIQSQIEGARAKARLTEANRNLENRVQQRTKELLKANQTLRREVAERILAEDTLLETQSRTNAILNFTLNTVIVADLDGRIEFINRAGEKLFGLSLSKALGQNVSSIFVDGLAIIKEGKARSVKTLAEGLKLEAKSIRSDGSQFSADIAIRRMTSDRGTSFLFVVTDATERIASQKEKKILESHLRQSQKIESLGTLAGGIAHEFNNLLMVIGGFVRRALQQKESPEHITEYLGEAQTAVKRAASVTKQLLVFSRSQIQEEKKVVDVAKRLRDTRSMLVPLIGEHIELQLEISDGQAYANLDPDHFTQAVINLVINARDAMPGGGWLTLGEYLVEIGEDSKTTLGETMKPGRYVGVYVEDQGVGIDAETLEKIFDPFFSTKAPIAGTGLGLAVVYGFVRDSGGYINVSTTLNEGTKFTLYFPWIEAELSAEPNNVEALPLGDGEVVMVLEDEDAIRDLMVGDLQELNYTVLSAADGIEAMEIEGDLDCKINLLLSDVMMPGFSGPETADALSKTQPNMKVIFMSGYAPEGGAGRSKLPHNAQFISKPVDLPELASKMREVLKGDQ